MKDFPGADIIAQARRQNGFYTVHRYQATSDKLRTTLKQMARDKDCILKHYNTDSTHIVYNLDLS